MALLYWRVLSTRYAAIFTKCPFFVSVQTCKSQQLCSNSIIITQINTSVLSDRPKSLQSNQDHKVTKINSKASAVSVSDKDVNVLSREDFYKMLKTSDVGDILGIDCRDMEPNDLVASVHALSNHFLTSGLGMTPETVQNLHSNPRFQLLTLKAALSSTYISVDYLSALFSDFVILKLPLSDPGLQLVLHYLNIVINDMNLEQILTISYYLTCVFNIRVDVNNSSNNNQAELFLKQAIIHVKARLTEFDGVTIFTQARAFVCFSRFLNQQEFSYLIKCLTDTTQFLEAIDLHSVEMCCRALQHLTAESCSLLSESEFSSTIDEFASRVIPLALEKVHFELREYLADLYILEHVDAVRLANFLVSLSVLSAQYKTISDAVIANSLLTLIGDLINKLVSEKLVTKDSVLHVSMLKSLDRLSKSTES